MQMSENRLTYSVAAEHFDDAEEIFVDAKDSLLDVNNWHKLIDNEGAIFVLTDTVGKELHRKAHKGDYIKLVKPGAASEKLHIDALVYDDFPDENTETFTMHLTYSDAASIIFMIERHGLKLTTTISGKLPDVQWHSLLEGLLE
jgi:hypothetical protein